MAFAGEANIEAAGKLFETLMEHALQERPTSGAVDRIATRYSGQDSTAIELVQHGAVPAFKQRTDELDYGGTRAYKKTCPIKRYVAAMDLFRTQVQYDRSGVVAQAIQTLTSQTAYLEDKLTLEVLEDNDTGIDGVALVGSTHPHGAAGASWDNSTSNDLSFAAWDTAQAFAAGLQDEESEYVDVQYDTLIVPSQEASVLRTALEIANAPNRPVAVATDSTIDSGGIGATGITNVYQGSITVIGSPRLSAGTWYAVDSRYPPVALCEWMAPRPAAIDQMDSEYRLSKDKFLFAVEADIAAYAASPWGVYGNPA